MGFNRPQWKFLNKSFKETGLLKNKNKLPYAGTILMEENYYGKKMLELGCQEIRDLVRESLKSKATAKSYFKSIGIDHVSIDIKGCHRSKKIDFGKPINTEFHNNFDIITNSGTTEHILPIKKQYHAFKNIHLCAKKDAVIIHILPGIGKYYGHCQIYYNYKFFEMLAELNGYKIVFIEDIKKRKNFSWIGVCFIKREEKEFCKETDEFYRYIEFISKDLYKKHKKNKNKYML